MSASSPAFRSSLNDAQRQSMLSSSSVVSSSAASFRTAPLQHSTSSSTHNLNADVNPIHTLAGAQEIHVVKVTSDTVQLEAGPMPDSHLHKVSKAISSTIHGEEKVGPPPPSPPASVEHAEGVLPSSPVIYDEPESYRPQEKVESLGRSSTETRTSLSTLRANTLAANTASDSALPSVPPKSIVISSPDGHLLPPPTVTHRPTRRNTTGSAPRKAPPPIAHRASGLHPRFSSQPFTYEEGDAEGERLASDIEAHAEQIRRERMEKRAKQQQEAEAALTRKDEGNGVLVGNLIGEDHVNYVLMYNMLTGIRIGVSRCQAKIKRPLTPEDFTAAHKYSFDIVGNELTPSAKYDFKFKDYASWVFRELREDHFHLDPADYLLSLTSKYILSELGSPGKSGSFFYFSRDYRFIIKTIRHSEAKFLLSILPQYYEHVKSNPHTLLSRFYGLHRVKLPRGKKIHFVIMNNLFPPHRDIHETYDLKGSTVGREYPEEKAQQNPRATLKDLNWVHRKKSLELGPEKRALLTEQLRRDAEFLKKIQVMDYSLLIGIHNMQRGNRDNVRKNTLKVFSPDIPVRRNTQFKGGSSEASAVRKAMRESDPKRLGKKTIRLPEQDTGDRQHFIFYQDEGGLRATDEQNEPLEALYYLGVIDILTPYNTAKKIEHIWKGMQADIHKISPVPPVEYADRFFGFMKAIMRGGEGGERFI